MKNILIDTNIVLDIALQRREFGADTKSTGFSFKIVKR